MAVVTRGDRGDGGDGGGTKPSGTQLPPCFVLQTDVVLRLVLPVCAARVVACSTRRPCAWTLLDANGDLSFLFTQRCPPTPLLSIAQSGLVVSLSFVLRVLERKVRHC